MNDYDRRAWDEVVRARERSLSHSSRRLIPEAVRARGSALTKRTADTVRDLPGADQMQAIVNSVIEGGVAGLAHAANGSLATAGTVSNFKRAGHAVELISDIRDLELRDIDKVKPNLDLRYLAAGASSGVVAGFAIAGGEVAAIFGGLAGGGVGAVAGGGLGAAPGAGVGAAPGTATVLGAMAGDAAAVVLASLRTIFHHAQYYGYDTNRPEERLRALGVLNLSTAVEAGAKQQAYREIDKLVNLLVRNAPWAVLDQNVIARILKRVLQQQTGRITKAKLSSAVPVAGIVIGAGFNLRTLSRVSDTAEWYYRERFLRDKYEIDTDVQHEDVAGAPDGEPHDYVDIPLADIVEEELALEPPNEKAGA